MTYLYTDPYNFTSLNGSGLTLTTTTGVPVTLNVTTSPPNSVVNGTKLCVSITSCSSCVGGTQVTYNGSVWIQDIDDNNIGDGKPNMWFLPFGSFSVCRAFATGSYGLLNGFSVNVAGGM